MRQFIRLYCVLIIFLAVSLQATGQPSYIFHHLSTDEGLSNSNVRTILKDSYGFLWIGTESGLNRYDGYGFKVYTLEGAKAITEIAQRHFDQQQLKNIQLIHGNFDDILPGVLASLNQIDLAFIDGNHRTEPTMDYFNKLLALSCSTTLFIFDDIHWSEGMEEAWDQIKHHPAVTLTIDLFFVGIVCINEDIKVKQHFCLRF